MNTLTDYAGLFNCLRPDAPEGYGAFDSQDEVEPGTICDYCKSYNGEIPTARFTLKDHFTDKIEIIDLCADCQDEDHIFRNKTVLRSIKL
jgi:hypothetical protein